MTIRDAVRRNGVEIDAASSVHDAAVLMESAGVGSLVVVDGGTPTGIVTDRDLVRRAMAKRMDGDARVDAVMSTPLFTIDAGDDIADAVAFFESHAVRRLVVVDGDALVGVLTVDDLLMNVASQLSSVVRPITAETLFGHRDSAVPATT